MANSPTDVSVIICTYSEIRWNDLCAAVESAQAQNVSPSDIVVVIDHNPRLLEHARKCLRGVKLVENSEARGLSGARNSGLAAARGDIIAFLDDDAIATPDWLEQLLAAYCADTVLGVGGAIEPLWQNGHPRWFPEEFGWVVGCTYQGLPQIAAPVRNLIGCNMSFHREVFEAVGGFRTGIGRISAKPFGCEETELCIRARQHWPQKVFLYQPRAKVYHQVPAARAQWNYFCARCYAEGRSKAQVARLVGASDGLASERAYTLRTLPSGIARGLGDLVQARDPMGLARTGAILAGLTMTTIGYLSGLVVRS